MNKVLDASLAYQDKYLIFLAKQCKALLNNFNSIGFLVVGQQTICHINKLFHFDGQLLWPF